MARHDIEGKSQECNCISILITRWRMLTIEVKIVFIVVSMSGGGEELHGGL
jgi:hypothetical protein